MMRPALSSGTELFRNITRDPFVSPEPHAWLAPRRREDGEETKQEEGSALLPAVIPRWREQGAPLIPALSPILMSTPQLDTGSVKQP